MRTLRKLADLGLAKPPRWLPDNVHYEVQMGSVAYGISTDASDVDLYGWCIPPKELVFPHLAGEIPGFGTPTPRFEQFQQHHIQDPTEREGRGREYDVTIFSVVKYFQLVMEGNPNLVDSLFVPENAVLHASRLGQLVRDQRRIFLHRGVWSKFRGYSLSQMHKLAIKQPEAGSRRASLVQEHGYDTKFATHAVRMLLEAEQLLTTGEIDLQRDRELLKAIRRGEWSERQVRDYHAEKARTLEQLFASSQLPERPAEPAIRRLLLQVLEEHYGSLAACVANPDASWEALREIRAILDRLPEV